MYGNKLTRALLVFWEDIFYAKVFDCSPLPTPLKPQEATPLGKAVKANVTIDAYWVDSWCQLNEEGKIVKILCQWNATNVEAVRDVITKAQNSL